MRCVVLLVVALALVACDRDPVDLSTLHGGRFLPAREILHTYCGSCHTKQGGDQRRDLGAYRDLNLDDYQALRPRATLVANALAFHGSSADMPPASARQPSPRERQVVIDWLARGCPNTASGI
jgi:uncharacterized membrane protein